MNDIMEYARSVLSISMVFHIHDWQYNLAVSITNSVVAVLDFLYVFEWSCNMGFFIIQTGMIYFC